MSNVNVYFGAQPSQSQIVSDAVKAKGVELLKIEPSQVKFHGHPTTVQPGYAVYKAYLPMFIAQALGKNITDFTSPFHRFETLAEDKQIPIPFPSLAISWNIPVAEEVKEQLRSARGFVDTVIRGKPAMIKRFPTISDARDALEKGCISTTAAPENAVNIVSLRKCVILRSLLTQFLICHQYPAFIDAEHESEFNKHYQEILNEHTPEDRDGMETDGGDVDDAKPVLKRAFKVSLPNPPRDMPTSYDETTMPKGEGLLFPFIPELAKFDRSTVIEVVRRYFYAGMGDTVEDCDAAFEEFVSAWGNVQNTDFGNKMAHIFRVIDISLTLQCTPHIMMTLGQYDGIFMRGSAFSVNILGRTYEPASRGLVDAQLPLMDKHANAAWSVIALTNAPDKEGVYRTMRSIKQLKVLIDTYGITGGATNLPRVLELAKGLRFPEDREWEPTAYNIALALSFITEPTKSMESLPFLHPSVLLSTDRHLLVWSAFGAIAPSFRVPGGKEMMLTKSFRITNPQIKKEKGPQGHRDVTKIGCILVPLEVAVTHLKTTLELKTVLNPHGNSRVDNSASHANKVFEGDSCSSIVDALRKAAKVTVVDEAGSKKRKTSDDETGGPSKKGRVDAGF